MKKLLIAIAMAALIMTSCQFQSLNKSPIATEPEAETVQIWGQMVGYSTLSIHNAVERMLKEGKTELEIFIMSPGGTAYDFTGSVDAIKYAQNEGIHVTTKAFGCVMSAAVPVFVAGDIRIAGPNTQFMVHRINTEGYVLSEDDIECITMLEDLYVKFVASHSSLTEEEVGKMMDEVTFFTAKQAERYGMVDEII
jgi:ATP-dependent protease ClpP protease subunit